MTRSTGFDHISFYLPELGEGIKNAIVRRVLVRQGELVVADRPIIELETNKASVDLLGPWTGKISSVLVSEDEHIDVGRPIAVYILSIYDDDKAAEDARKLLPVRFGLHNLGKILDVEKLCNAHASFSFRSLKKFFDRAVLLASQFHDLPLDRLELRDVGELELVLHDVWQPIIEIRNFNPEVDEANIRYPALINRVTDTYERVLHELLEQLLVTRSAAKPRAFIGSSTDYIEHARHVQALLDPEINAVPWPDDHVFRVGLTTIESLEAAVEQYDYGIFIFGADEKKSDEKGQISYVARDNVVFEYGLFLGKLSRQRALIIKSNKSTILTDLLGVTTAPFEEGRQWKSSLGKATTKIRNAIEATWPWWHPAKGRK